MESVDAPTASRLKDRLKSMAELPYAAEGLKKLGNGVYRLKQGDWRALILIDDEQRIVMVDRVVRRNEATYR